MITLGLLGGMSWESTASYYAWINRYAAARLGGLHSARLLLYSLDFADIEAMQSEGRWAEAADLLADGARRLERAGAGLLVLCTNTMHAVFDELEAAVQAPWLHIADATAREIAARGIPRVGLLGTRYTMEGGFYRSRLERHGVESVVPAAADRELVHRVIYDELCLGRIEPASRAAYRRIVARLASSGCEAVVLGCTEIGLLLGEGDAPVPLLDTARIHAETAAAIALGLADPP